MLLGIEFKAHRHSLHTFCTITQSFCQLRKWMRFSNNGNLGSIILQIDSVIFLHHECLPFYTWLKECFGDDLLLLEHPEDGILENPQDSSQYVSPLLQLTKFAFCKNCRTTMVFNMVRHSHSSINMFNVLQSFRGKYTFPNLWSYYTIIILYMMYRTLL